MDRLNREIRTTSSRRVRVFLEERVIQAEERLSEAEDSLATFQAENQTLAVSSGKDEVISTGAGLLMARFQLVTEAEMLRSTLGSQAPALKGKEMEIRAVDKELSRLPRLNSDLAKLMRSRRVLENTYTFLSSHLEETRIEEARDTPTVDVLDPPLVPEEKSWPQRTWTVLGVFISVGVFSLVLAKGLDSIREAREHIGAQSS